MALCEFALIDQYFASRTIPRSDVSLGIGDDAAVLTLDANQRLVTASGSASADADTPPALLPALGRNALAAALLNLAASGAQPQWTTLALSLPAADELWLENFSTLFFELANRLTLQLVGGDVTRGPARATVGVHGTVSAATALSRQEGETGDGIFLLGGHPTADVSDDQIARLIACATELPGVARAVTPYTELGATLSRGRSDVEKPQSDNEAENMTANSYGLRVVTPSEWEEELRRRCESHGCPVIFLGKATGGS